MARGKSVIDRDNVLHVNDANLKLTRTVSKIRFVASSLDATDIDPIFIEEINLNPNLMYKKERFFLDDDHPSYWVEGTPFEKKVLLVRGDRNNPVAMIDDPVKYAYSSSMSDEDYEELINEHGDSLYCVNIEVKNDTPMDYSAACMINIYKHTGSGEYVKVDFSKMTYAKIHVDSEKSLSFSIALPKALTPGDYNVELYIANNFSSYVVSDYFVFDTKPLTVSTTGIKKIGNGQLTIDNNDDVWYDLHGRMLTGKPTQKGIYLNKGRKISIY